MPKDVDFHRGGTRFVATMTERRRQRHSLRHGLYNLSLDPKPYSFYCRHARIVAVFAPERLKTENRLSYTGTDDAMRFNHVDAGEHTTPDEVQAPRGAEMVTAIWPWSPIEMVGLKFIAPIIYKRSGEAPRNAGAGAHRLYDMTKRFTPPPLMSTPDCKFCSLSVACAL